MFKYNLSFLLIFLSGCALFSTPELDTLNKQIAAVETGYTVLLKKVLLWQKDGLINKADQENIVKFMDSIDTSLDAVYVAKGLGELANAENQLKLALTALEQFRAYALSKEKAK